MKVESTKMKNTVLYNGTPTLQDVAKYAQVSTATVSRALSQPDVVSKSTLRRVNKAIEETGYVVNEAARSLRRKNQEYCS